MTFHGLGGGTFLDMTSDPNLNCGLFQLGMFRPECWAASEIAPAGSIFGGTGTGVPVEAWLGIGMLVAALVMMKR